MFSSSAIQFCMLADSDICYKNTNRECAHVQEQNQHGQVCAMLLRYSVYLAEQVSDTYPTRACQIQSRYLSGAPCAYQIILISESNWDTFLIGGPHIHCHMEHGADDLELFL
jgi:hypothetical protein